MKGIENKKMYHNHFHLRFFRVVFNSGKFVVKTDRRDKKMKSFPLSDLESVECFDKSTEGLDTEEEKSAQRATIISKDEIIEKYGINEIDKETMWKYCFNLNFTDRQFELACRTFKEFESWVRVFELIMRMKELNLDLEKTNPFEFEKEHGKIQNTVVESYRQRH